MARGARPKPKKVPAAQARQVPDASQGPSLLPALGAAALAGVLYFSAFPGFDLWPLALVALVPLFAALDREVRSGPLRHRRVLAIGVTFGTVTNMGGYYWLIKMLEDFSGFPFLACLFFALVVCAFQGGLLALFAWLWARARARGWPAVITATCAFAASEQVYPLLFQSYYGNHFHGLPVAIQVAELGGPILITAIAVAINAAVYELGRAAMAREPLPWRNAAVVSALVGATLLYGVLRIDQVDSRTAAAPAITVGVVQTNMGIYAKHDDPHEGRRRHIEQSVQLENEVHPDLIVWPESAYTYFVPSGATNLRPYVMGPVQTPVLFGGLARRSVDGEERHYNTAFLLDAEGNILGTYDKTYLLAFGEYLPLGDLFPILYEWSPHSGRFTPGDHVRAMPFGDYRISTLICYEDILPRFVRSAIMESDPHLLVNITNDSWFGDTSEPWQHLALAKLRAVEHRRYLVRSTNSGISAIIDPVGRTIAQSGLLTRENLSARVHMMSGWTPYEILGDWPGWIGLGAIVWFAFRKRGSAERG